MYCFIAVNRVRRMFDVRSVYRKVTGHTLALVNENMLPKSRAQKR